MPPARCISDPDLRAYMLGQLPERIGQSVATHLDGCPDCDARASQLEDLTDPLIQGLRRALQPTEAFAAFGAADTPDAAENVTEPSDPLPRRIGRYTLLAEVGRGGMAVVYQARQDNPDRIVALKVLLAGSHSDAERRARFRAEADTIGQLRHAHIVQVYEAGEHDGLPFLVLEFCEGGNLAQRLRGTPQAAAAAADLVEPLARAVEHAHQAGVVHRDLKPANVLLTADGTHKVADFGLAKVERPELTATGAVLGTPSYMAPEQATGSRAVGPPADVYALGAILYELLTGRPPFQGANTLETLAQVRGQEPVPPRRLQPAVPRDLETVCLKCLEKEPARRYVSAGALADELRRFQEGRPVRARPVGTVGRSWRWARRNPLGAGVLASATGVLLAVAVGSSWMSVRLNDAVRAGEHRLWESHRAEARAIRLSGRPGQRFESLAAIRKALALPVPPDHSLAELRDEAIACLVLADIGPATDRPPLPCPADEFQKAIDRAFERFATVGKDGYFRVRRVADGREIARVRHPGSLLNMELDFSPDGRFLMYRDNRDVVTLLRLDGDEPTVVLSSRAGAAGTAFSGDSRHLAIAWGDNSIGIYDTGTGKPVQQLESGPLNGSLAFNPGEPQLAVASGDRVQIFDTASRKIVAELPHPAKVGNLDWHPQRRALATSCVDRKIRVWDVDRKRLLLPPLDGHQSDGVIAFFDRAGDRLISNDWEGLSRLWDPRSGRLLVSTTGSHCRWRFAPDDRYLAEAANFPDVAGETRLLRVATGRELRTLGAFEGGIAGVVVGPDERLLITGVPGRNGLVFFDQAHGAEVGAIPRRWFSALTFEPDGALLTYGAEVPIERWPFRTDLQTGVVHVGPPQAVFSARAYDPPLGSSVDARVLGIPAHTHATIVHRPDKVVELGPCEDARHCAISPDGRWAVTGNHNCTLGFGAQVWDAHRPRHEIRKLPVGGICDVGFSPDGRWLITTGGGYRLWRVGSWEEGPTIAQTRGENGAFARFAFTRDSKLLAVAAGVGQVRLVNPETGSAVACLAVPEQTVVQPYAFSADGAELTAIGITNHVGYTWDLRAIRSQLRELGLDWDAPEYPPPSPVPPPPLRVQVEMGEKD
jgi:eukaryotic-like serine/threonine-protein kinase